MADYVKLRTSESDDEEDHVVKYKTKPSRCWWLPYLFLLISTALNVALIFWRAPEFKVVDAPPSGRYAKHSPVDTVWNRFFWHTRWDSGNRTESDLLWDRINPAHGFVAIDTEFAANNGWPESMYLPSDHSKGVYLLEAYHGLHCLKIVRQTFHEAVERRPYTYDPHHAEHCFDALRQSVVCNADSTPLYTFGDKTAGDGQVHKCRSWEQLRDWATQNTACYKDSVEEIPLNEHFGHCENLDDGIPAREFRISSNNSS